MLIAAALTAIAVILYFVFLKSGTPEDTIEKMEHALNNLDQEELLECFDNQIQGLYSGALSVGGERWRELIWEDFRIWQVAWGDLCRRPD